MTRTIHFFSSSGERLFFRHAENKRPIDVSLEKYTKHLTNEELVRVCSWPAMVCEQGTNQHRCPRNGLRPDEFRDASTPEVAD